MKHTVGKGMTGELHVACCMLKVLLCVRQVLCRNCHPEKAPAYTHHGLEGTLRARLVAVAGPVPGASVKLVGTMAEDSANVVFPETPEEEEEGEQGMLREVDISWMAEHAKQVLRLLPDILTVLGFFLVQSDSFLVANGGTCT